MVFDTNVVVSALIFSHGTLSLLRAVWAEGRIVPVVNRDTVLELTRVLQYPKFHLEESDQHELLGEYLPFAEDWPEPLQPCGVNCGDPNDQVFLDLAVGAGVDAVVTGDRHIRSVGSRVAVAIMEPAAFVKRIEQS